MVDQVIKRGYQIAFTCSMLGVGTCKRLMSESRNIDSVVLMDKYLEKESLSKYSGATSYFLSQPKAACWLLM